MSRKLKESSKEEIRNAFLNLTGSGVPEHALVRMLADHVISLLELPPEALEEMYEDGYTHDDFVNDNT